jgi:hypothetical protein
MTENVKHVDLPKPEYLAKLSKDGEWLELVPADDWTAEMWAHGTEPVYSAEQMRSALQREAAGDGECHTHGKAVVESLVKYGCGCSVHSRNDESPNTIAPRPTGTEVSGDPCHHCGADHGQPCYPNCVTTPASAEPGENPECGFTAHDLAAGLYHDVNRMMAVLGAEGEISTRHPVVQAVMAALATIDGGGYDESLSAIANSHHDARGGGEAVPDAWLVESELAGKVCAEIYEVAADNAIADVIKEYGSSYGSTTKRPLYLHPTPAALDAEWTDVQCIAFMATALRHVEYKRGTDGPTCDDIRLGVKFAARATNAKKGEGNPPLARDLAYSAAVAHGLVTESVAAQVAAAGDEK